MTGIRVLHLYDEYLNIYADRGNIQVLQQRCLWRGLTCDVGGLAPGETFDPDAWDLIYVGGGQDRDQQMIAQSLVSELGGPLLAAQGAGVVVLAVCGGYQLLGHEYLDTMGVRQPGVGLLDIHTVAGQVRMIGNVAIECELPASGAHAGASTTVVGFENHAGRTTLGPRAKPFGRVVYGHGNDGISGFEGARDGVTIGTYLHGPLLPRNPELADWLLAGALAHRLGEAAPVLAPLDDSLAARAHAVALSRAKAERHRASSKSFAAQGAQSGPK